MSSPSQAIIIKNPDGSTGQITVTANGLKCDVVLEAQNVTIGNIHLQDAVNAAYILKIDANGKIGISSLPTGTAVTANSTPITLASDDPIAVAIKNAVANILPKGQATMANSAPVALASDQTPPMAPAVFSVDVTVTTNAAISADTVARDEVLLMADLSNTDTIKVGVSTPTFPLAPGFWVAIRKTQLSLIFAAANSGSQVLHVLCGGS